MLTHAGSSCQVPSWRRSTFGPGRMATRSRTALRSKSSTMARILAPSGRSLEGSARAPARAGGFRAASAINATGVYPRSSTRGVPSRKARATNATSAASSGDRFDRVSGSSPVVAVPHRTVAGQPGDDQVVVAVAGEDPHRQPVVGAAHLGEDPLVLLDEDTGRPLRAERGGEVDLVDGRRGAQDRRCGPMPAPGNGAASWLVAVQPRQPVCRCPRRPAPASVRSTYQRDSVFAWRTRRRRAGRRPTPPSAIGATLATVGAGGGVVSTADGLGQLSGCRNWMLTVSPRWSAWS